MNEDINMEQVLQEMGEGRPVSSATRLVERAEKVWLRLRQFQPNLKTWPSLGIVALPFGGAFSYSF